MSEINGARLHFFLALRQISCTIVKSSMKKFGATISIFAMLMQSTAFAFVGGPYGNNTYDGLDDGIFQYTLRGRNVTGLARFSQSTESAFVSPIGDSIVYMKGIAFYGDSYGFVDTNSKTADGIINGTRDTNTANAIGLIQRFPTSVGFGVRNNVGLFTPSSANGLSPSNAVNAHWKGKITSSRPSIRFSGKGKISLIGDGEFTSVNTTVATRNFNVGPNGTLVPTLNNAAATAGTGAVSTTIAADTVIPEIKEELKVNIRVTGGRISVTPVNEAAFP